jgi:hypothetical protein
MPNRDRTGPEGKGPKTGKGLGKCKKDKKSTDKKTKLKKQIKKSTTKKKK